MCDDERQSAMVLVGDAGVAKTPKRKRGRPPKGTKVIRVSQWHAMSDGIPPRVAAGAAANELRQRALLGDDFE